ncbi:hypothetical protein M747DRAFT_143229 [Aspergillus niger ATCC 13496]|uniref:Transmembrane protein n=1 Tax=Aspergillus niger ATCC 13496 TaxID=1353008 RepID=A0A370BI51_ASPNG|nr:hypothetical protein M747DRAFT_143229 [Aspergillus niger ATCC 13496]
METLSTLRQVRNPAAKLTTSPTTIQSTNSRRKPLTLTPLIFLILFYFIFFCLLHHDDRSNNKPTFVDHQRVCAWNYIIHGIFW